MDSDDKGNDSSATESPAGNWISKRDRHMQLINPAIYDQQTQARAKAIEKTRQEKLMRREKKEKLKLKSFIQRSRGGGVGNVTSIGRNSTKTATTQHEIVIGGARYHIAGGGSKLVKISGKCGMLRTEFP